MQITSIRFQLYARITIFAANNREKNYIFLIKRTANCFQKIYRPYAEYAQAHSFGVVVLLCIFQLDCDLMRETNDEIQNERKKGSHRKLHGKFSATSHVSI